MSLKLIGWKVIVPLGIASLLTGLVQSLGTSLGLFRHYWIVLKFVLTVIATVLMLLHMRLADRLADLAASVFSGAHMGGQRVHIAADAAGAVLLLIVNTVLSVYKPRGLTPYGIRKQREECQISVAESSGALELQRTANAPLWVKVFGITALVILVLFRVILVHVSGGGGHHFH